LSTKPPAQKPLIARHEWLTPVILAIWEAKIRRVTVGSQPGKIVLETPSPKIIRAKWTGCVAEAVEHLFFKCEVLSSNFRPIKKKTWRDKL
jgi:hypothetical protein